MYNAGDSIAAPACAVVIVDGVVYPEPASWPPTSVQECSLYVRVAGTDRTAYSSTAVLPGSAVVLQPDAVLPVACPEQRGRAEHVALQVAEHPGSTMSNPLRIVLVWVVLACTADLAAAQFLLVTDGGADTVRKYDLDGTYLGDVIDAGAGGVNDPLGIAISPAGDLLVSGDLSRKVHRYDLGTGVPLGDFAAHPTMVGPAGLAIHDGRLYVSDGRSGTVFRFDAETGDYIDDFITGMAVPEAVLFAPSGDVIVGDWLRNEYRVFDGGSGTAKSTLVTGDGLNRPWGAAISGDGDSILTVNFGSNTLTEHAIDTGDMIRTVDLRNGGAPMNGPVDWVTLDDGTHVVSSALNGTLLRYDEAWGYIGVFAEGDAVRSDAMVLVPAPGTPCRADVDGDGELTLFDFLAFQNAFDAGDLAADFDDDGMLTLFDFLAFQNEFDAGCV
ncbi:MAG: GC-type dockerin domain-anchored protein [Planctomycetota bacterium]